MKLEQIIKLRKSLFEDVSNDISANNFADYPWDKCIADQTKAYGSKSIAEAVCGKIKSENQSKQKMESEDFKIPEPNAGESQNDYVSRCMKIIGNEPKPQDQLVAMCIATYENK